MLTAAEAAAYLGVKVGTLYAYVSRGWLKSYKRKVGRETLYRLSEIEALRGVAMPERGRRARSLPDASTWVTIAQPRDDGAPPGVIVAESAVSSIIDGQLAYRGYPIEEVVAHATFEEVCLLLWNGERPSPVEVQALRDRIDAVRIPSAVVAALRSVGAEAPPLSRLAIMLPVLAAAERRNSAAKPRDHATMIIGAMPTVIASARSERAPGARSPAGSIAAQLLQLSFGAIREPDHIALDRVLVACAEHELNASTLAARVVASTGADLYASVLAALCSLSGPIHGGACDRIELLLAELESRVKLDDLLDHFAERHLLPPGFGHAIYPEGDPRALLLKSVATEIARHKNKRLFEMALANRRSCLEARAAAPESRFLSDHLRADAWPATGDAGRGIRAGPRRRMDRA